MVPELTNLFTDLDSVIRWPLALFIAWLGGELAVSWLRVPRVAMYALFGFLLSSSQLGLLPITRTSEVVFLVNSALALILFELGYRINLRWLKANPWLAVTSIVEASVTFALVFFVAHQLGMRLGWFEQKIFPSKRFDFLSDLYGYLMKQVTVFGQHVHIGCESPNQALWLLHALNRYLPHFIALSAASPFSQGIDTGFYSSRLNSLSAFPLSGRAPFILDWGDFPIIILKK